MFTDINIYPINNKTYHISEKYIFLQKKSKTKVDDIFPILGRIWSRIRIRYFTKRSSDPDPYQNETDPQHWLLYIWAVVGNYIFRGLPRQILPGELITSEGSLQAKYVEIRFFYYYHTKFNFWYFFQSLFSSKNITNFGINHGKNDFKKITIENIFNFRYKYDLIF